MKIIKDCEVNIEGITWFPAQNINFLCQRTDKDIVCKAVLPDGDRKIKLYNAIFEFQDKLFLIPWRARQILVYDQKQSGYIFLENDELIKWREKENKYIASVCWGNNLYLIGCYLPYIVKIDTGTNNIVILSALNENSVCNLKDLVIWGNIYFASNYVLRDDVLWVPMVGKMAVVELNLKNDVMRLYEFPMGASYTICDSISKTFWLYCSMQDSIVKWSYEYGVMEKLKQINLQRGIEDGVLLEYTDGILQCKSSVECIYIDIKTGNRIRGKIQNKEQILWCDENKDEIAYTYFDVVKDKVFIEQELSFFDCPICMYLKYIENKSEKQYFLEKENEKDVAQTIYGISQWE